MLNLDTPVLLNALKGSVRAREMELLSGDAWGVSGIVMWELARLIQLGRIRLDLEDSEVKTALSVLHIWPVDGRVARASLDLEGIQDPADQIIAATSVVHRAPLVTRDPILRAARNVPLAT